jgi:hypothetical protein
LRESGSGAQPFEDERISEELAEQAFMMKFEHDLSPHSTRT